jgi:hypothetical protein
MAQLIVLTELSYILNKPLGICMEKIELHISGTHITH